MIVGSDGQRVLIEEERSAPSSDCPPETPEPAGQMLMIRKGVEALLANSESLRALPPK